jgi:hypothetical protein
MSEPSYKEYDDCCPFCAAPFNWIKTPPEVKAQNSTPDISPSLSDETTITCPYCDVKWNARTGKEIIFGQ